LALFAPPVVGAVSPGRPSHRGPPMPFGSGLRRSLDRLHRKPAAARSPASVSVSG